MAKRLFWKGNKKGDGLLHYMIHNFGLNQSDAVGILWQVKMVCLFLGKMNILNPIRKNTVRLSFFADQKSHFLWIKKGWEGHYNSVQNGCQEPWLYATNSAGMCIRAAVFFPLYLVEYNLSAQNETT